MACLHMTLAVGGTLNTNKQSNILLVYLINICCGCSFKMSKVVLATDLINGKPNLIEYQ